MKKKQIKNRWSSKKYFNCYINNSLSFSSKKKERKREREKERKKERKRERWKKLCCLIRSKQDFRNKVTHKSKRAFEADTDQHLGH